METIRQVPVSRPNPWLPLATARRRFGKIMVANRGEIAIRIMRAAHESGIETAAIYPEADAGSLHRFKATESHVIGHGKNPLAAYLDIEEIAELAARTGCDAVHPGYGFLSENAQFARACRSRGVAFIGPSTEVLEAVADKISARRAAEAAGVPCIPGVSRSVELEAAVKIAESMGYPVMLKAAAGGGGRGIRSCRDERELRAMFPSALRESAAAFGRGELFVEKRIERPKHIEVQILGDSHGNVVHLFERDCSVQRRFQKVVEMTPAPTLPADDRAQILDAAVRIAREVGYDNAGTVEFLYAPESRELYFMEINARLQVEHTITEVVTGVDLVKAQIRIAEGESLDHPDIGIDSQESVRSFGAAIQCRVTCEEPERDFVPDFGRVRAFQVAAGLGVRLDEAISGSAEITPHFDSLIAKVTVHGRSASEAISRMRRTLQEIRVDGVRSNVPFLRAVMEHPNLASGDFRTDFIEAHGAELKRSTAAFAEEGARAAPAAVFEAKEEEDAVAIPAPRFDPNEVVSSLPGLIVAVQVAVGDEVKEDDILFIVESMKVEMTVTAPMDGIVTEIAVAPGDHVSTGQLLARLE